MAVALEAPVDSTDEALVGGETIQTSSSDQSWSVSGDDEAETSASAATSADQDTTLFDYSLGLVQALQAAPTDSGAAQYGVPTTDNDAISVTTAASPVGAGAERPQFNGASDPVVAVANSGVQSINGLIGGNRWSDGSITYSDPDAAGDYQAGYSSDQNGNATSAQNEGFSQFSAQQMIALHYIMNQAIYTQPSGSAGYSVEGFTNLTIDYAGTGTGSSTMRYANTSDAGTAYNFYPSASIYGGDGWFGPNTRTPTSGNYSWMTTIHEVGHGLGLAHGHTGGAFGALPSNVDSHEFSIMTYRSYIGSDAQFVYNETYGYPQTFMMLDIQALQYMYGADFTSNGGDTVYTWDPNSGDHFVNGNIAIDMPGLANSNRVFMTIWDGNGIDTYNLSNYSSNLRIDLRPGENSTLATGQLAYLGGGPNGGYARGNVFNALLYNGDVRSLIENATGGTGNDTITGNQASNVLRGGAGLDTLDGREGNDFLYGDAGNDSLLGGTGNDFMAGGANDDTYSVDNPGDVVLENANEGIDRVYSLSHYTLGANLELLFLVGTDINGAGNGLDNYIYGTAGRNNLQGNGGVDRLSGFGGDDVLNGGAGNDAMAGGTGNDIYYADSTYDQIAELVGEGNDTVYASANFWLQANVEVLRIQGAFNGTGNSAANFIYGDINTNGIRGGGAADYMSGGGGFDTFVLARGETQGDVIADFDGLGAANGDRLLLSGWGAGAFVTSLGGNNWLINSSFGNEYFQLANGYSLHASDFTFV